MMMEKLAWVAMERTRRTEHMFGVCGGGAPKHSRSTE
jgi:hypothetical protein